jgi:hypothetical protein
MKNKILLVAAIVCIVPTISTKAQVPSYLPTSGLLAWYPFNGNANDETGNGNHCTGYNGAALSADRFGNSNSAYLLDGVDDYIKTIDPFYNSSIPHSISMWWKTTDSTQVDQAIWSTDPHTIESIGFNNDPGSQKIDYCLGDGNWGYWLVTCNEHPITVSNFNTWHHIVMVRSATNWKFYDNGVLVHTVSSTDNTADTLAQLWFGAIYHDAYSEHYFKGYLDDIGIWERALTETEIASLYNYTPGCQSPISFQPVNRSVTIGNNQQFLVVSSGNNFQWQTDLGTGFQDLTEAGQYNGTTNDTLTVFSTTLANNGQLFRCIVTGDSCIDTSTIVSLTITAMPSYIPLSGLQGWYPFNGNASDESGNLNNPYVFTYEFGFTASILTTDRFGNANSAYHFLGDLISGMRLEIDSSFSAGISFCAWKKGTGWIMNNMNASADPAFRGFGIVGDCAVSGSFVDEEYICSPDSSDSNSWQFVVGTWGTDDTIRVYINGQLKGKLFHPYVNQSGSIFIANDVESWGRVFHGNLDDICIYNRALSPAEISLMSNTGCMVSIFNQPHNQNVTIGNSQLFSVSSSAPNATFQWQSDTGSGFQNLSNTGQFSGTTDDTLMVSGATVSNNGQLFRCIVMSDTCQEISDVAMLTTFLLPANIPSNGLLAWYPFNGNANDESCNEEHCDIFNGTALSEDRFGNINSAYQFDGNDDYIKTKGSFYNSSLPHTISLWWKTTDPNKQDQAFYNTQPHWIEAVRLNGYGNPEEISYHLGSGYVGDWFTFEQTHFPGPPDFNIWHHFVLVRSTTDWKFYDNGLLIHTDSTSPNTGGMPAKFMFGATRHHNEIEAFFKGYLDDIAIWNRALTFSEITSLHTGINNLIITQPDNQNMLIGNTAQFIVVSSDVNSTYQWQKDFVNLSNTGQFSGSSNDTLTVSNISNFNNNQMFRCIVSSGSMFDTSTVATLTVNNNLGISEVLGINQCKVYPNPAKSQINVEISKGLIGSRFIITDLMGKTVLTGKLTSGKSIIEVGELAEGVYAFSIGDNAKQTFTVIQK